MVGATAPVVSDEFGLLLRSFWRSLRARNRSPETIHSYEVSATQLGAFLVEHGMPTKPADIRREHVEAFIGHLLATRSATTALTRYQGLRAWFTWLTNEGEIPDSPMAKMKPPQKDVVPPTILTDDQLRALLKACDGRAFAERRDLAIVRLLIDTGMRRSELAGLTLDHLDLEHDVAVVMGKGRRVRACPFGHKTASALDRYVRARTTHRDAHLPALWLGQGGPLTGAGIYQLLERRARQAGIAGLHPHLFRHGFAHSWLAAGGQEGDLMRLGGWRSREMLARYGAAQADTRAREAYRTLSPGDRV